MNIIITGTGFGFPDGTGATARVTAFAKGMMHHGAAVHVFCPKPTESEATGTQNLQLQGIHEGIPFEYTCGQRHIAKTRLGAFSLYLKGLWRAASAIRRIHRQTPVDAILLWYPESFISLFVFRALAASIGTVLIAEKSELPFVYFQKTFIVRAKMWFNDHITYKVLDGVIVISGALHEYFRTRLSKSAKMLRVPILVDTSLFTQDAKNIGGMDRKIIYCGNLDHDGEVAELLCAFAQLATEFPRWSVEIIGPMSKPKPAEVLRMMVVRLGLVGRVLFVGAMARTDIPARLLTGDIMALPRASGPFSAAGFPTKLGEYLASGKPVVVTNTGEISQHLQDRVHAFFTPPGDTEAFTRTLHYVISHPDEAGEVGFRGREVAINKFSSLIHGGRIIEFIQSLKNPE